MACDCFGAIEWRLLSLLIFTTRKLLYVHRGTLVLHERCEHNNYLRQMVVLWYSKQDGFPTKNVKPADEISVDIKTRWILFVAFFSFNDFFVLEWAVFSWLRRSHKAWRRLLIQCQLNTSLLLSWSIIANLTAAWVLLFGRRLLVLETNAFQEKFISGVPNLLYSYTPKNFFFWPCTSYNL